MRGAPALAIGSQGSLCADEDDPAELHRSGTLSDIEFANAQAQAIHGAPLSRPDAMLRDLHAVHRSRTDCWLGGVCGGLGETTGLPSWIWRLIFAALILCAGTGAMLYIVLWILLPQDKRVTNIGPGAYGPDDARYARPDRRLLGCNLSTSASCCLSRISNERACSTGSRMRLCSGSSSRDGRGSTAASTPSSIMPSACVADLRRCTSMS